MNPVLQFTYPLAASLTMAIALGLGFLITRRFKLGWRLFWIGGAVFLLSQVFHIPFNAFLTRLFASGYLPQPPASWASVFNAIILGLSAGIFEETANYLGYRYWARDARTWSKGLLYGAGHGGAEAIAVGGLLMLTYFQLSALRGQDLAAIVPAEQVSALRQALDTFWSATWYDSFLSTLERALTLPIQIGFAILVLQVFVRRRIYWLFIAILWHAAVDAIVLLAAGRWNVYQTELLLGFFALASLAIIYVLRQPEPEPESVAAPQPPALEAGQLSTILPLQAEETPVQVDESRYL